MSLYAEYLLEKTNDKILEIEDGFITYRHLPADKATYIIDIYIRPEKRNENLASNLADLVVREAKELGHMTLLGSVIPSSKGSDTSIKVLQAYGMTLKSASENFIIFEKPI